jgi:hypothetical protein
MLTCGDARPRRAKGAQLSAQSGSGNPLGERRGSDSSHFHASTSEPLCGPTVSPIPTRQRLIECKSAQPQVRWDRVLKVFVEMISDQTVERRLFHLEPVSPASAVGGPSRTLSSAADAP